MKPTGAWIAPAAQIGAGLVLALATLLDPTPARTEETCWTGEHAQFFNAIKYCVSSVLPPQGDTTFGPDHLARWDGDATKAWCEGAPDFGLGETIKVEVDNGPAFRRLLVSNGYAKSSKTYTDYARVKTAKITGDNGLAATLDFPDNSKMVPIDLPKMPQKWIQLKIVDVYPGESHPSTCLGFLTPDFEHEEELLLEEQGLLKKPQ